MRNKITKGDSVVKTVALRVNKETIFQPEDEIIYAIASGSYCDIITKKQKKINHTHNLKSLENNLSEDLFLRLHQSYLVNKIYISKILHHKNMVLLTKGEEIPVSRRKKPELKKLSIRK